MYSSSCSQQFINEFSKTHSKETIRKLNRYIKSSLDDAVYKGLLPKNITYKVTFNGSNPPKDEQSKFINLVEYETLKQYFKLQKNRSSLALFIMICTGCRISGVLNMKYEYINQVKNELFIDERKHNVSIYYISKRLGHKNISVTTEIYSHLLEEK